MYRLFYLIYIFIFTCISAFSQIAQSGIPESFHITTKSIGIIPVNQLPKIDTAQCLSIDKLNNIPNRYGVRSQVNIDIKAKGVKTDIPGKGYIWQVKVSSENAKSLGVYFKKYHLPDSAKVFLYNENHTLLAGAFTKMNNKASNELWLADFKGTSVIIEYFEPYFPEFEGELLVGAVSQAYKDIVSDLALTDDINCTEGEDWMLVKHAVCKMVFSDADFNYYCTGALINNIRNDCTPYFLTANHCIDNEDFASSLIVYFNYETEECGGAIISPEKTLSGATLLATYQPTDYTLLLLDEDPPANYIPFFAGWDASSRTHSNSTCIHHPSGNRKSIAIDNNSPVTYNGYITWDEGITSDPNTHWEVEYESGSSEGGSSGAPLFNDNKHIIGQLHGGNDDNDYFGKLSRSWEDSDNPLLKLKTWLDPDNTGIRIINGNSSKLAPVPDFSVELTNVCINTPVMLNDLSEYNPTSWTWDILPTSYTFVNGTTLHSQNPQVTFNSEGNYSISLMAGNSNGANTLTVNNIISAKNNIDVSFVTFPEDSQLCGSELNNYLITVTGAHDYVFDFTDNIDRILYNTSNDSLYLSLNTENNKGSFVSEIVVTGSHGTCISSDTLELQINIPINDNIQNAIALTQGYNGPFTNKCANVQINLKKIGVTAYLIQG
jgi:PKD repeat protein